MFTKHSAKLDNRYIIIGATPPFSQLRRVAELLLDGLDQLTALNGLASCKFLVVFCNQETPAGCRLQNQDKA